MAQVQGLQVCTCKQDSQNSTQASCMPGRHCIDRIISPDPIEFYSVLYSVALRGSHQSRNCSWHSQAFVFLLSRAQWFPSPLLPGATFMVGIELRVLCMLATCSTKYSQVVSGFLSDHRCPHKVYWVFFLPRFSKRVSANCC